MRRLLVLLGLVLTPLPVWSQAPSDQARAVLDRAITAHGGEQRLSRLRAGTSRAKGTLFLGEREATFTTTTFVQMPYQFKHMMTLELDGRQASLSQVLSGERAQRQVDGQLVPVDLDTLRELREQLFAERVATLVVLKQIGYELRFMGDDPVKGRPAWHVRVSFKGHRDISLFFDKESNLLVKTETRVLDQALKKEVLQEKILSDYELHEGLPCPRRVVVYRNGDKYLEMDVLEHRRFEKLDDSLFSRP